MIVGFGSVLLRYFGSRGAFSGVDSNQRGAPARRARASFRRASRAALAKLTLPLICRDSTRCGARWPVPPRTCLGARPRQPAARALPRTWRASCPPYSRCCSTGACRPRGSSALGAARATHRRTRGTTSLTRAADGRGRRVGVFFKMQYPAVNIYYR